MKVKVRLLATLRSYAPSRSDPLVVEVSEGSRICDLLEKLPIPPDVQKVVLLNGRHARDDQPVGEGDLVTIFPPVEGG